jgi:hypothetical protein
MLKRDRIHSRLRVLGSALAIAVAVGSATACAPEYSSQEAAPPSQEPSKSAPSGAPKQASDESPRSATTGQALIVHAVEFSIAKAHRADNKVHPYGPSHAFTPFILPDGMEPGDARSVKNPDGSVSVFFATIEDMLSEVTRVSHESGQQISVLNIHTHGVPGANAVPQDRTMLESADCETFKKPYAATDEKVLEDAYTAGVVFSAVTFLKAAAFMPDLALPCSSGLEQWKAAVSHVPEFPSVFADQPQVHFMSCLSGRGLAGEKFATGIGDVLFPKGDGTVMTSIKFGVGDWSTPEGMGFWDPETAFQLEADGDTLKETRKVATIAQPGEIRVSKYDGQFWNTSLLEGRKFMPTTYEPIP